MCTCMYVICICCMYIHVGLRKYVVRIFMSMNVKCESTIYIYMFVCVCNIYLQIYVNMLKLILTTVTVCLLGEPKHKKTPAL
jgi:hypothetical protein